QMPDVPTLLELTPPDKKDIVDFLTAGCRSGGPWRWGRGFLPTGSLRCARRSDDVMKDPAFLAEAAKRKLDIDPRPAAYPHALASKLASASPELVARVETAIG